MANWLNQTPSAVDTGTFLSKKWANSCLATPVQKLVMDFNIPSVNINPATLIGVSDFEGSDWQMGQFNYTAPSPFTIPQIPVTFINTVLFYYVIRYRIGGVCTRYVFSSLNAPYQHIPLYTGQTILPQFSIELWYPKGLSVHIFNSATINVPTSILISRQPNYLGNAPIIMPPIGGLITTDLFIPAPTNLVLPLNWPPNNLWNSN